MAKAPQLGAKRKPIEPGHHDIEEDEVRFFVERLLQARGAIRGGEHAVTLMAQTIVQRGAHRQLVFND